MIFLRLRLVLAFREEHGAFLCFDPAEIFLRLRLVLVFGEGHGAFLCFEPAECTVALQIGNGTVVSLLKAKKQSRCGEKQSENTKNIFDI